MKQFASLSLLRLICWSKIIQHTLMTVVTMMKLLIANAKDDGDVNEDKIDADIDVDGIAMMTLMIKVLKTMMTMIIAISRMLSIIT